MLDSELSLEASYNGEDIQIRFCAAADICDYGVPGPKWLEPYNPQIVSLTILGIDLTPTEIRQLPDRMIHAFNDLANEIDHWKRT